MRLIWKVGGLVLVSAGTIWILQGLNVAFAPESFMTGNQVWVAYGAVAIVVGLVMIGSSIRRA